MKQLVLPLESPPAFEAKDFIRSKANEDAYLWLMRWPNWPQQSLAIYGEEGCGKTHLSHLWEQKTNARRLKGEEFNQASVSILLEGPPFFILDQAHLIAQDATLFHLYNHLIQSRGGLLFLSKTPPAAWPIALPDLRSRLNAMPAVKIHAPDDDLLRDVMQKLFGDLQIKVDENVVNFLLLHMERSFESARVLVNLLNRQALIQNRRITIPFAREILLEQASAGKCL